MASNIPKVSIVMSVYNGDHYLREAVDSILAQTFKNFEFIVIDDGSTDNTWAILQDYAKNDSRIILVRNTGNIGLPRSLNEGLALAKGIYIARQDADDISLPERLATQVSYLDQHPLLGILGTAVHVIDDNGNHQNTRCPAVTDTAIRWKLLFNNAFCHTSVMIRASILEKHQLSYDNTFQYSQDYELWTRIMWYTQGENLEIPLVCFRDHNKSISFTKKHQQWQLASYVSTREIKRLFPQHCFSQEEINALRQCHMARGLTYLDLSLVPSIIQLFEIFQEGKSIEQNEVKHLLAQVLQDLVRGTPISLWWHLWMTFLRMQTTKKAYSDIGIAFFKQLPRKFINGLVKHLWLAYRTYQLTLKRRRIV